MMRKIVSAIVLFCAACHAQPEGPVADPPTAAAPLPSDNAVPAPQPTTPDPAPPPTNADTLDTNRNRLLGSYLTFLQSTPAVTQSNGLSGGKLANVCELWSHLDSSSQSVFLTLTARLQGSKLGEDGSSMLAHVTKLYRVNGGQGANASNPGSCGGGEFNRMIMSMDEALHTAQVAAFSTQGGRQPSGAYDIADVVTMSFWRNSHDLGGPHAPFDTSDETDQGGPRGQTQYFRDPTSKAATSPLGRTDLMTLVDPYALEMDQDYDCVHNSNPSCSYFTYGPLCSLKPMMLGTQIYKAAYGDYDGAWKPAGCP
jgi:hypothetical protein